MFYLVFACSNSAKQKKKKKKKKKIARNMSNIFKVNNKDTRTTSGASIANFEHISHF